MLEYVEKLMENGYAYETSLNSIHTLMVSTSYKYFLHTNVPTIQITTANTATSFSTNFAGVILRSAVCFPFAAKALASIANVLSSIPVIELIITGNNTGKIDFIFTIKLPSVSIPLAL